MSLTSDKIKIRQVQKVPTNDTNAAGGTGTTNDVTGASNTEVLPNMAAQESGTLGTDIERQYQGMDLTNTDDTYNLENPFFFIYGLIKVPTSATKLHVVSTSSSDNSTKKRRHWCKVGSALVVEDIICNGTTSAIGAQNVAEVYLARTLLTSNDDPATPAGDFTLSSGATTPDEELAKLIDAYDWMSGQLDVGFISTLNPTAEWTNRKTDPVPVGYSRARSLATAITCPVTIDAGGRGRIIVRQTLEPGCPGAPMAEFKMSFGGDGSA